MVHLLPCRCRSSALLGASAGPASADASYDYKTGLALGQQAFDLPLPDRQRTFPTGRARGSIPPRTPYNLPVIHAPTSRVCGSLAARRC